MKKIYIETMSDVASFMHHQVCVEGQFDATFVGCYDDVVTVLNDLAGMEDTFLYRIDITPRELDSYDEEYLIALDDELNIWCYKAKQEDEDIYLYDCSGCLLISDYCNKEILEYLDYNIAYEVLYNNDVFSEEGDLDCDGDCDHCEFANNHNDGEEELVDSSKSEYVNLSHTKDGKLAGFTKSWSDTDEDGTTYYSSFSHYGSNEDFVKKIAREFGIKLD